MSPRLRILTCGWILTVTVVPAGFKPGRVMAAQPSAGASVTHRLEFDANNPNLVLSLPAGVATIDSPPANPEGLAVSYRTVLLAGGGRTYRSSSKLYIVSAGPLLDHADRVNTGGLERKDGRFTLAILYSSARLRGAEIRKNVAWRPLIQVALPEGLAPGRYQIEVSWQAVEPVPNGKPLDTPPLVLSTSFEIHD